VEDRHQGESWDLGELSNLETVLDGNLLLFGQPEEELWGLHDHVQDVQLGECPAWG
jgi:hypothetical protein